MEQTQILLGQLAAVLAVIQIVPYVRSILRGETKPSRASYGIWLCVELVLVSSYFSSGATTTKWIFLVGVVNSFVLFLLSLKYGMRGFHSSDLVSIILALIAIGAWVATNDPAIAVYLCMSATIFGYIPTIRKSYSYPKTENKLSWGIASIAAFFNICALNTLDPAIAIPPLVSLVMPVSIYLLLRKNLGLAAKQEA